MRSRLSSHETAFCTLGGLRYDRLPSEKLYIEAREKALAAQTAEQARRALSSN